MQARIWILSIIIRNKLLVIVIWILIIKKMSFLRLIIIKFSINLYFIKENNWDFIQC